MKNYDRAIDDLNEAIRLDPKDAEAYYFRGQAKKLKGDSRGADADMATAHRLDSRYGSN